MTSDEKIMRVMKSLKNKNDISPKNSVLRYYAGRERNGLDGSDEILILNKLSEDGLIEVVGNFSSEAM